MVQVSVFHKYRHNGPVTKISVRYRNQSNGFHYYEEKGIYF